MEYEWYVAKIVVSEKNDGLRRSFDFTACLAEDRRLRRVRRHRPL